MARAGLVRRRLAVRPAATLARLGPQELTKRGLSAAALLGLATLVYVVALGTSSVLEYDQQAMDDAFSDFALTVLGDPGEPLFMRYPVHAASAASLCLLAVALGVRALARGGYPELVATGALVGGCFLTGEAIKWLLGELTPLAEGSDHALAVSFPSVHSAVSAAMAVRLAALATERWSRAATAFAFAYPAGMGVLVVMLGWHYPSDVVGGLLFGGAWAVAFAPVTHRARPMAVPLRSVAEAVALSGAVAVQIGLFAATVADFAAGALTTAFALGITAIVATAVAVATIAGARAPALTPARRR